MATEDPETPSQTSEKKTKKNQGSTDNSPKKRKRELEEQQGEVQTPTEAGAKKSKKKHQDARDGVEEVREREVNSQAKAGAKKLKKEKRREDETVGAEHTETHLEGENGLVSRMKRKKKKASSDVAQAASVGVADEKTFAAVFADDLLQSHSPFVHQTASFYVTLSPCAHHFPLEGVCAEHISPSLLNYYPPLKGVVLSYSNPRMSEHPDDRPLTSNSSSSSNNEAKTVLTQSVDEYGVTYVWLTADFLLFRPRRGTYLEGYVNLQNESILGLVCYNYFNAGVERARLPRDWQWVGDEEAEGKGKRKAEEGSGYFVDGGGVKVEGRLVFRVKDFEASPGSESGVGSISIFGTLLSEEDDETVDGGERRPGFVR